jgi:hypothetical protein
MSDENAKTGDGIHVNHWCSHPGCKEWGAFGFAATKSETPQWWCWEHYPHRAASVE